jgi:hypothetical protein
MAGFSTIVPARIVIPESFSVMVRYLGLRVQARLFVGGAGGAGNFNSFRANLGEDFVTRRVRFKKQNNL